MYKKIRSFPSTAGLKYFYLKCLTENKIFSTDMVLLYESKK